MQVYPIHLLDNAQDYRKPFLAYLLVFNDVLDPQRLTDSLSELLQTGDWKKLGGRLRKTVWLSALLKRTLRLTR